VGGQTPCPAYLTPSISWARKAMMRYAFDPRVPYDPSGGWSREQCDPGCCWRDEDAECPVEPDSEQHI
jgi:hypothetical protein